nr:TPA_inf: bE [Testicularia cyperi]
MSADDLSTSLLCNLKMVSDDLLTAEDDDYSTICTRLTQLEVTARAICTQRTTDDTVADQIWQTSERIKIIASTFLRLDEYRKKIQSGLSSIDLKKLQRDHRYGSDTKLAESLPSSHLRRHFLSCLDDPYPLPEEKNELVKSTNEYYARNPCAEGSQQAMNHNSLALWYINARRRSGWSSILRKYARNDRQLMKPLIQAKMMQEGLPVRALLSGELDTAHAVHALLRKNLGKVNDKIQKDFHDDFTSMISWIRYGVRDKTGDWVQDVVNASKKKTKHKRGASHIVTNAGNRSPLRKSQSCLSSSRGDPASQTRRATSSKPDGWTTPKQEREILDTSFNSCRSEDVKVPGSSTTETRFNIQMLDYLAGSERQVKRLPSRGRRKASSTVPAHVHGGF